MSANHMALDVTAQANSQGQDPTAVSAAIVMQNHACLLYTSPSPRD